MARPIKTESEKFKYRYTFWFNDEQKKIFEKHNLKSGEKVRDFVLDSINTKTIIISSEKDPKYISELNKIGVNLNQIARKYNTVGEMSNLEIEQINNLVAALLEKIKQL